MDRTASAREQCVVCLVRGGPLRSYTPPKAPSASSPVRVGPVFLLAPPLPVESIPCPLRACCYARMVPLRPPCTPAPPPSPQDGPCTSPATDTDGPRASTWAHPLCAAVCSARALRARPPSLPVGPGAGPVLAQLQAPGVGAPPLGCALCAVRTGVSLSCTVWGCEAGVHPFCAVAAGLLAPSLVADALPSTSSAGAFLRAACGAHGPLPQVVPASQLGFASPWPKASRSGCGGDAGGGGSTGRRGRGRPRGPGRAAPAPAPAPPPLRVPQVPVDEHGEEIDLDACAICYDPNSDAGNTILFCDRCNVAVHQHCYGVAAVPEGDWFCDACASGEWGTECSWWRCCLDLGPQPLCFGCCACPCVYVWVGGGGLPPLRCGPPGNTVQAVPLCWRSHGGSQRACGWLGARVRDVMQSPAACAPPHVHRPAVPTLPSVARR
jgi:hypothetical protein